jgi:hypothetical protein
MDQNRSWRQSQDEEYEMMGYRGEDLDLRTPQTWSATPADLAAVNDPQPGTLGARGAQRPGPIWVDDTVLACANHAFDVALAHRAAEVRIEHLLHALTRIDAAAEALEARGVRVAALRRESAMIIASEIPIGLPNGKGAPRRSEDVAEVLRLAAANAARRNAPATIEDLLHVLFDQRSDVPGLSLLARNAARSIVRETVEPLPPLTRYAAETRYMPAPQDRYVRHAVSEPRYMSEPQPEPRYMPEPPRTYRAEYSGTPTDAMQNTRIEALEQMVRALGNDLAGERQLVSGLLKDLSRETQAQRDDQGRLHTGLYDRLQNLEQVLSQPRAASSAAGGDGLLERLQDIEAGLELRLNDMSNSWSVLSDRLQSLELAIRETKDGKGGDAGVTIERILQAIDLKPISNRLDIIEEALLSREPGDAQASDVADRLKSLEGEIARALSANTASTSRMEALISGFERRGGELTAPLVDRVNALHTVYQGQQAASAETSSKLLERMTAVERALAGEIETSAAKHQAYTQDLKEVHEALMKLNQNQHTLAGSMDQWRTEAAGDVAMISNRLANLDRDNERPYATLNAMTENMDRMNRLMIEKYHRRHRFWYWLFGTDDWISASWPSQVASIASDRQKMKVPTA